ncbi:hypothetical protein B0H13DRAFT_2370001 [Mycena leptocephala]|nr:hypothetical protein B0H13DRAFT_2370001 [Mycena leptocephala]
MARGQRPLDAETKAKHRQDSLQRYASKCVASASVPNIQLLIIVGRNSESLRSAAREHSRRLRARQREEVIADGEPSIQRLRARASAARYREKHREEIRATDTLRRAKAYLVANGTEAFDEKIARPQMAKTQKRHEGRPPPQKPRVAQKYGDAPRAALGPCLLSRKRCATETPLTENQRRCRGLRASGFEDNNGEDSDADLPPGMCGCDLTECQRMHKNESAARKDWKIFHLKYAKELADL